MENKELEKLAEEVHHLYCAQYLKDHGEEYWTKGDYSKLEERIKEYDRNIVRWHLEALTLADKQGYMRCVEEALRVLPKEADETYHEGDYEDMMDAHYNKGWNKHRSQARDAISKLKNI